MIKVEVSNTLLKMGDNFVVLLRIPADQRALPISIGQLEAQSIAIKLNNVSFPRPLTHDLFRTTLQTLGCPLVRVEVCDLVDDTFYARLVIDEHGKQTVIDARPSDAISLALRFGAPIYVDEKVMDLAGVTFASAEADAQEVAPETGAGARSPLEKLQDELAKAIKEERYEAAALLRDEIKKLTTHN